jgi:hypothetical protein
MKRAILGVVLLASLVVSFAGCVVAPYPYYGGYYYRPYYHDPYYRRW